MTLVPRALLRRLRAQQLAGILLAGLGVLLLLRGLAYFGVVPQTGWW